MSQVFEFNEGIKALGVDEQLKILNIKIYMELHLKNLAKNEKKIIKIIKLF